jgi:hypothetical protein
MIKQFKVYLFLLLAILNHSISAQNLNYPEIFRTDWQKAESFVSENKKWMEPAADKLGISYELAESVIFPELVRYSALRDKIEITLLKALYINLGEDYANFSIGQFQIKPTFAEKVREYAEEIPGKRVRSLFSQKYKKGDVRSFRALLVSDLENPVSEWNYILAFFVICEKNFDLKSMDDGTKLSFLSTAYNYGFYRSAQDIEKMRDKKFYNTKLLSSESYSYSDVALFRYNQLLNKK